MAAEAAGAPRGVSSARDARRSTPEPRRSVAFLLVCTLLISTLGVSVAALAQTLTPVDIAAVCPPAEPVTQISFEDAGQHEGAVNCLAQFGVLMGRTDGTYGGADALRRDQMASILVRFMETAHGQPVARHAPAYGDVSPDNAHAAMIGTIATLGVTVGVADGLYQPAGTVTRAQMATFIVRVMDELDDGEQNGSYPPAGSVDFPDMAGSAHAANIRTLAALRVVVGASNGSFTPNAPVQRGQVASMLARAAAVLHARGLWAPGDGATDPPVVPDQGTDPGGGGGTGGGGGGGTGGGGGGTTPANRAPVVATPVAQQGAAGQAFELAIQATDADGDTLSFGASGLPPTLSIAAATGIISGVPSTAGSFTIEVAVSDGTATTTVSFPLTITTTIDLRLLLLSSTGTEPTVAAWQSLLSSHGVPFDTRLAAEGVTPSLLATGDHAHYQGIVVATNATWAALDSASRAAIEGFQRHFGIRQVTSYVYPGPDYGLTGSPQGSAGLAEASLTAAGRAAFPYLAGPVPIESWAWGYTGTTAADPASFDTYVAAGDGSTLVGVFHRPDGREELVSTVDMNGSMAHARLLLPGMLEWVTQGVHTGVWRTYLSLHIDDTLLADDRWDTLTNTTPEDGANPIRMVPADVARALQWQADTGLTLDMVYNGLGASEYGPSDPLTDTLLANRGAFRWINHTLTHLNLDAVSQATIVGEILGNIDFAGANDIDIDVTELVTGEHSGLTNPDMADALAATGIRWIASDNSRTSAQTAIGPALTVPRYPTNLYYNVGTRAEQLDEYNYVYYDGCVPIPGVHTCLTAPATWGQYVDSEASIMLSHVTGNDPRPHYLHQSNLAEDGVMYDVVDELLARYHRLYTVPMVQPTLAGAGALLRDVEVWTAALADGDVTASLQGDTVVVTATQPLQVPLSGTTAGSDYAGSRSGWTTVDGTASFAVVRTPAYGPLDGTVSLSGVAPKRSPGPLASVEPLGLAPPAMVDERIALP